MKKTLALLAVFLMGAAAQTQAVSILAPGDAILGGVRAGTDFEVGVAGFAAGTNNWPAPEPPEEVINGIIGGGGEKYLNFAKLDTGFIVTPTGITGGDPTVLTSMELWVANDAVDRDPASFEIWGTNISIGGGGPFALSDFALISQGALALPDARDTVADAVGNSQVVAIGNGLAYTSYMLLFPTVKNAAAANSMQISEVQFDGRIIRNAVPTPVSLALMGIGLAGIGFQRRKRGRLT